MGGYIWVLLFRIFFLEHSVSPNFYLLVLFYLRSSRDYTGAAVKANSAIAYIDVHIRWFNEQQVGGGASELYSLTEELVLIISRIVSLCSRFYSTRLPLQFRSIYLEGTKISLRFSRGV